MVVTMALVLGLVNAIDMPLRQSLAPDLVPRRLFANAMPTNRWPSTPRASSDRRSQG